MPRQWLRQPHSSSILTRHGQLAAAFAASLLIWAIILAPLWSAVGTGAQNIHEAEAPGPLRLSDAARAAS
jgi:hypothetical protein